MWAVSQLAVTVADEPQVVQLGASHPQSFRATETGLPAVLREITPLQTNEV